MKKILIIIPAYNVAGQLETVLYNLNDYKAHCLIVNDGSTDNTSEIIERERFRTINMPYNSGVSKAVLAGLSYSLENNYRYALLMDADGQHNPCDIDKFISALNKQDIVFANRFDSTDLIPSCKMAANCFASVLYKAISDRFMPDVSCGFKAFKISADLFRYLKESEGYSIIYRLVNYMILSDLPVSFIPIDAIYSPDHLLCTRTKELLSLLSSAIELERYCPRSSISHKSLNMLYQSVLQHKKFEITLCGIRFFSFFLNSYDSYIIQASLREVQNYYGSNNETSTWT